MAQLRDARTSELIAEGTPTELVLLADALELNSGVVTHDARDGAADELELIYDDVGNMDVDAVRAQHREHLEATAATADSAALDDATREAARGEHKRLRELEETARRRAGAARKVLDSARDGDRETLEPIGLEAAGG